MFVIQDRKICGLKDGALSARYHVNVQIPKHTCWKSSAHIIIIIIITTTTAIALANLLHQIANVY
eukprot:2429540-Amphidinium_carterae.1